MNDPHHPTPLHLPDAADRYHAARAMKAQLVADLFVRTLCPLWSALQNGFARTIRASPCPPPRSRAAR